MKTNSDATLYNKSVVNGAESWTRHEIKDVAWEGCKAANVIKSGLLEADRFTVYIPFTCGTFTFNQGDILVRNIVTDVISTSFTITALKAKYPESFSVHSVDRMDMGSAGMHHWQVGGS